MSSHTAAAGSVVFAAEEADLASLLASLCVQPASSASSCAPAESVQSSHVCAGVLEGMRARLEGSDGVAGHSVHAAAAAWRFLSALYGQAESLPVPAAARGLVQSAAVSHALLLLQEPGLFVEDQPAPPPAASASASSPPPPAALHSLLPVLLAVIITWLGDEVEVKLHTQESDAERSLVALPAAQQSAHYRFFQAVWAGVLEAEAAEAAQAGDAGLRLPEDADQPDAPPFFAAPSRNCLTSLLFSGASTALRQCSLLDAAMLTPLRALRVLLSFPALSRQFVSLDEFVHPWMNGYLIETGNVLASVLKGTCLPDDPVVGDTYFASPYVNGQLMPDVEREFVMALLSKKIDAHHALVADIFEELLAGSNQHITRAGLIAWIGCVLLANYTRTRMAANRRSASNDGFLLNLGAVLLQVWSSRWSQSPDATCRRIDARFAIHGVRLELHDETRLAASIAELTAWAQGQADWNKFAPPQAWRKGGEEEESSSSSASALASPSQSAASAFFLSALKPRHPDIVCDRCRARNFQGARFKCASCNDYDVCSACATGEFAESLGLAPKSGVLFACPYRACAARGLSDNELRAHVAELHTNDGSAVICPICAVNAGGVPYPHALFANPQFLLHLQHDHGDTHNPLTHVFIKVPRMVPHIFHRRLFQAIPTFTLQSIAAANSKSDATSDSAGSAGPNSGPSLSDLRVAGLDPSSGAAYLSECARVQSGVVHRGVTCARCQTADIRGVCYRCAHCANYSLCARCEAGPTDHPAWHSFLQMRRPPAMEGAADSGAASGAAAAGTQVLLPQLPMSLMYASALTGAAPALPFVGGSCPPSDPSLESVFFFLTLHSLHVGFCKTCARYTSLVQALDVEADPRAIETLLKVKLCVDAQLLQPSLLAQALSLYVLACKWMLMMIDPAAQGLPLPTPLPMEFAALPEYIVEDACELLLFLTRFAIDIVSAPEGRGVDIAPMLRLFTTLLATPAYCTNPYLRAKLVEVICSLADNANNAAATLNKRAPPAGLLSVLSADRFMQHHLVGALVRLYVDIEHTGSASSFYEKFNVRHAVGVLLKLLTVFAPYAAALNAECVAREERVVQFENAIINDLVFLIDESMIKAQALHTLQRQPPAASVAARRAHADQQSQLMRSLRTASVLAGHTVSLLSLLCSSPGAPGSTSRPDAPMHLKDFDHSAPPPAVGKEAPSSAPHCPYGWQCYRANPLHRAEQYHAPAPKVKPLSPFPLPFGEAEDGGDADSCLEPYTLLEISLMRFAASVREKPSWWTKVHDESIVSKWISEAKASEPRFNDVNLRFMIDELKYQASKRVADPIQESCANGIYQADGLVPADLRAALEAGVARLENVPEDKKDYHPGSNKQVIDLVHPSLYCLRIGFSKETNEPIPLAQSLEMFGAGEVKGPKPVPLIDADPAADGSASSSSAAAAPEPEPAVPAWGGRRKKAGKGNPFADKEDYAESSHFAWLPSDFSVDDAGKVRIDSYVNSLHPTEHADLYPVLERVCELFLPMWERVLCFLKSPPEHRINVTDCDFYSPPADIKAALLEKKKAARAEKAAAKAAMADEGKKDEAEEEEEDEDDDEESDHDDDDDWQENRPIYLPDITRSFKAPADLPLDKQVSLNGRKLQIIVKLANIELTPENPAYKGGSWHVEGMMNERIVASGIYYYHSSNISESRLAFRQACEEPGYEQSDYRGMREVYGLANEEALNQPLGSLVTQADRMIAFPNIHQHQVQPFELVDKTKPGLRKILVFFLCDPAVPVVSTATVPPQQLSWFKAAHAVSRVHRAFHEATPLIDDLINIALEYVQDELGVITEDRAKKDRAHLMDERKFFVTENNTKLFEREFSLCEH